MALRNLYLHLLLLLLLFTAGLRSASQQLAFRHLSVQEGAHTNHINHACFDSSGLVWGGSVDGLIVYDGTTVKQYISETHPGLPADEVQYLFCDSRNRIWICTGKGLSVLDEYRRLKRVIISDTLSNPDVDFCVEAKGLGIIAIAPKAAYLLPEGKDGWVPFQWFDEQVRKGNGISSVVPFNKTAFLLTAGKRAVLADFVKRRLIVDIELKNTNRASLCKLNDHEILVTNGSRFEMYRLNIATNSVSKTYAGLTDETGKKIETAATYCTTGFNGIAYIATRSAGLIAFNPVTEKIHTYNHDPLNPASLSSNSLRRVYCHQDGFMIITGGTGLNYTNLRAPVMRQFDKFADNAGNIIDNIIMVGEDGKGKIWLGSIDKLFSWNPQTNEVRNISVPPELTGNINAISEAANIFRDNKNFMWVSYNGRGLAKFSSGGRLTRFLTAEKDHLPTNRIRIIRQLQNGLLMLGAEDGIFMLHPETFAIDSFTAHPLLKAISKKRVVDIYPDGDDVWFAISTNGAAYCYNFKTRQLKTWSIKNGLNTSRVYCITKDFYGNMYIGGYDGLNVLSPDGKIRYIKKGSGLRHTRVDNLVTDREGKIWLTNFSTLICYNPANRSFTYFDEQNGVSRAGFHVGQARLTSTGQLLFCNSSLLIADPHKNGLANPVSPQLIVNRLYEDGGYTPLPASTTLRLPYDNPKISFYYLVNNFMSANRFFYRYKMEGLDTGWAQPTKNNEVTYNLRPGKYVFRVQSSYIEGEWKDSNTKISITVLPPWWQRWWFIAAAALALAAAALLFYKRRIRNIKTKAAVQQQLTELEARALRAQMNPHFIFNSLNAIQELIITGRTDEGYRYLSDFSKLLRLVLNHSEQNFIALAAELEMIKLYMGLEELRFRQSFAWHIEVDESIEADLVRVPPLLLQPYIENAVWHGLRHKEGEKRLLVRLHETERLLHIEIDDNGIGREKAAQIKQQKLGAGQFESKGTALAQHRLDLLNRQYPGLALTTITDKKDAAGNACGTTVLIQLPLNI